MQGFISKLWYLFSSFQYVENEKPVENIGWQYKNVAHPEHPPPPQKKRPRKAYDEEKPHIQMVFSAKKYFSNDAIILLFWNPLLFETRWNFFREWIPRDIS